MSWLDIQFLFIVFAPIGLVWAWWQVKNGSQDGPQF